MCGGVKVFNLTSIAVTGDDGSELAQFLLINQYHVTTQMIYNRMKSFSTAVWATWWIPGCCFLKHYLGVTCIHLCSVAIWCFLLAVNLRDLYYVPILGLEAVECDNKSVIADTQADSIDLCFQRGRRRNFRSVCVLSLSVWGGFSPFALGHTVSTGEGWRNILMFKAQNRWRIRGRKRESR